MIEFFTNFLTYQAHSPLIFTNANFWIFFMAVLSVYSFVYNQIRLRNIFLMVASLFFYYKSSGLYFVLIIVAILHDFYFAHWLYQAKDLFKKRLIMIWVIVFNLSLLFYFKYAYFLTDLVNTAFGTQLKAINLLSVFANNIGNQDLDIYQILLPVGISFYTFQSLSYAIDIYRNKLQPVTNLFDYAFFVSFFPQLVAGPIVRASEFIPQIFVKFNLTKAEFSHGVFLIISGLAKKIIISDYISINFVDRVFGSPQSFTGFENLMAIYGYTIQIYCDFSGYTDIAIGLALLLGFRLNINFNRPYLAKDITDFWRRWHISLSTWLKDYLYISLGGNRKGNFRTYFNLFATMVIGGLWHGAHLKFVVWGAFHGLMLIIHKWWEALKLPIPQNKTVSILSLFLTFHLVAFCWIFFRAESIETAIIMITQIIENFGFEFVPDIVNGYAKVFIILLCGYLIHFIPKDWINSTELLFAKTNFIFKALLVVIVITVIYQFKTAQLQPFIYFQF